MTKLLLLAVVVIVVVAALRSLLGANRRPGVDRATRRAAGEDLVRDPQCLAYVPQSRAVAGRVGGEALWFCSDACAERYRRAREA